MIFNILSYLLLLLCCQRDTSNGMILTGSYKNCEELDQPTGWTIRDLKDVNLSEWPLSCLYTKYDDKSIREAIGEDVIFAVVGNHMGFVQYFIEKDALSTQQIDQLHLLHMAAALGHLDIFKFLVTEKHATVDFLDDKFWTPLQNAVVAGRLNVIKFLVEEKKVDVNCRTPNDYDLLHLVVRSNNVSVMKYLLDDLKMSDRLNEEDKYDHDTPLLLSSRFNFTTDVTKFLIDERHQDFGQKNSRTGASLLENAVKCNNLRLVKYLIEEKGADLLTENREGKTPLYFAYFYRNENPEMWNYIRVNRSLN